MNNGPDKGYIASAAAINRSGQHQQKHMILGIMRLEVKTFLLMFLRV